MNSVIHQESTGNSNAISPVGAVGLGQIMPSTAIGYGMIVPEKLVTLEKEYYNAKGKEAKKIAADKLVKATKEFQKSGVQDDRFDPMKNVNAAVKMMAELLTKYDNSAELALIAYNWGQGNLDEWLKTENSTNRKKIPDETKRYVAKVLNVK
jgi:soluble lytic murein transglycosylase-like protein